ncbi:MAG: energy transducer TonB [Sphingomicrobium sp.]
MKSAFLLLAVASAASARQPPIAVTNSPPPPIVAVPTNPGTPRFVVVEEPPSPPLPPGPRVIRPPQLRGSAPALVSRDDYPPSARAQNEQGRVDFTLTVGANGRVVGCAIIRSSGSAALDSATCRIFLRRARFTPAIDSNGNPAVGTAALSFDWRLP